MYTRFLITFAAATAALYAQPRRAQISGGPGDSGKCTIEVVVDGSAEVEVRGDTATLRNINGQPPQWRRFICTSAMPSNPADFRFSGVDGRGRQELVRDPRNGGSAVVRIEDPEGGSEGYTFDLTWGSRGGSPTTQDRYPSNQYPQASQRPQSNQYPQPDRSYRDNDSYHRDREQWGRSDDWRGRFFERIREDLDHVAADSFRGEDRYRVRRLDDSLNRLQDQTASGQYDPRLMDDVIDTMRNTLRDERLSDSDRAIVSDDLNRLREMRERR